MSESSPHEQQQSECSSVPPQGTNPSSPATETKSTATSVASSKPASHSTVGQTKSPPSPVTGGTTGSRVSEIRQRYDTVTAAAGASSSSSSPSPPPPPQPHTVTSTNRVVNALDRVEAALDGATIPPDLFANLPAAGNNKSLSSPKAKTRKIRYDRLAWILCAVLVGIWALGVVGFYLFSSSSSADAASSPSRIQELWTWPITILLSTRAAHDPQAPVIVYHLQDSITSETCLRVAPEHIRSGYSLGGKVLLHDLRTSLLYHMASRGDNAICAQHVGVPLCYCILDTKHVAANGSVLQRPLAARRSFAETYQDGKDHYIELFNHRITGLSRNRLMLVQEKNVMCKTQYWAKRFATVYVEYLDANGDLYEKLFNGTHAYNLQHATEIHHGLRTCSDETADALLKLLRGRLTAPGDDESQAMLLTSPEVHRNYAPPLAAPLPTPKLPSVGGRDN